MDAAAPRWTFFIAHAGPDLAQAEALYELLAPLAPTFLDSRCIELGDDWDRRLAEAQRQARISVILVSGRSDAAYYQREEIAAAIALARADDEAHRVVPVYLDAEARQAETLYGLRLKHGLQLGEDFDIAAAAQALLGMMRRLDQPRDTAPRPATRPPKPALPGWRAPHARLAIGGVAAVAAAWFALKPGPAPQPEPQTVPVAAVPQITAGPGAECLVTRHFTPSVIPHYLLNSFGSDNFPYWLRIEVENRCTTARNLIVRFESSSTVRLIESPQTQPFYVEKGEERSLAFTPAFDAASSAIDRIRIVWSLEDDNETKLVRSEISTEIVQPLTVAWDLRKPAARGAGQGEPVEPAFVLGSLKAWILKPPPAVVERGRACRRPQGRGASLEREPALRACYQHLFRGDTPVQVSSSPMNAFPAGDRQLIRKPAHFLQQPGDAASSLEAALLFVATLDTQRVAGIDPELRLVVAPAPGAPAASRTAYVAWRDLGGPWRAVDLQRTSALDFDANADAASARIQALFDGAAATLQTADREGAAFGPEQGFAIVDFAKVPERYQIRGLP